MKRLAKGLLLTLLVCVIAVFCLWKYHEHRRKAITGEWSGPVVRYSGVHHGKSPAQSASLIHYSFSISQTAKLKHPYHVWRDTAWEKLITERKNTIAKGYAVSIVKGPDIHHHRLPAPIIHALWSQETAFCQTKEGWFSIDGATCEPLPASFTPPHGVPNLQLEKERLLPTQAHQHPEIAQWILETHLSSKQKKNFYEPLPD
jgi:hypothetical protein